MGFSLLEPFGDTRADDRARGVMSMTLAAAGAKNVEPDKFLPTWQPEKEADPADALADFMAKMDAMAGYDDEPPIS